MFLGLGGSRRRGAQASAPGLVSSPPLQQQQEEFVLQQPQQHQGDPLQALATGKYALPGRAEAVESSLMLLRSKSWEDPVATKGFGAGRSPRSTLNLSWETSRASGDSSGVSVHAGEEASSRFEGARQQSQALALAKKLRNSLGSKFADSLRETIKEVAKREGESSEAWPHLLEAISGGVSRSESAVNACWPVEKDGNVVAQDRSSLLSFSSGSKVTRAESSLKASCGGIARPTSKVSSWLPQASWEVRSQAQVTPSLSSSMDSPFFPSGGYSSLLGEGDTSIGGVSGAKGQWMDGFTTSTRPAAVARRQFFPEAAALGTSRPEFLLQQISKPNLQETYKDQSLVDAFKGFQGSGKDCGSFLEFLNPGHPSNQALLDDARHRLYGKPAAADSCQDSVSKISGTDWCPLEFPESGGVLGFDGVLKRTRDGFSSGSHVKSSKRQCMASGSVLLDIPSSAIDADCEVKCDSEFKDYFANLTASRESSYELPGSSLAELMEDLSQDLLIPHVSS